MSSHATKFCASDEIYLLSHSVGLPPRTLRAYVEENYFGPWETRPEEAWPEWLAAIDRFRDSLAGLSGGTAASFCPQANVSSATTKILYALPGLRERRTILLSEGAFPSLAYVFQMSASSGFRLKYIDGGADAGDPEVWKEHLTADVGLALLTHVHSNSSLRTPVKDIAELTRERGIISIVDVAQSVGVLPIDVLHWNADFVVGSCVKWVCGGPGAGFLWANPSVVDQSQPIDVGWFSHYDPFEFDLHRFRYAPDSLRFWGGTPSILPYIAAKHAIDTITQTGLETIVAHNVRLCARLIEAVDSSIFVGPRNAQRCGGTVVIDPGEREEAIKARLKAAKVRFDVRRTGIRLSPHIYNNDDDIDMTIDCLR